MTDCQTKLKTFLQLQTELDKHLWIVFEEYFKKEMPEVSEGALLSFVDWYVTEKGVTFVSELWAEPDVKKTITLGFEYF